MSEFTLIEQTKEQFEEDEILSLEEMAEKEGITRQWLKQIVDGFGIKPSCYKKNPGARDTPCYGFSVLKLAVSKHRQQVEFDGLSPEGKLTYISGILVEQIQQSGEPGIAAAEALDKMYGTPVGTMLRDTLFELNHHKAIRRNLEQELNRLMTERQSRRNRLY